MFFTKYILLICLVLLPSIPKETNAESLTISHPINYQVVQRTNAKSGLVKIQGSLAESNSDSIQLEARIVSKGKSSEWTKLRIESNDKHFQTTSELPAGGWYRLEVRVLKNGKEIAVSSVENIGIGEVFVIAGQSNSANHGEAKQVTVTQRASSFDGTRWQIANDPQPIASGGGGSFIPPFADAIAQQEDVPVGIVSCGIGATSVREWLPKGTVFPFPPTLEGRVERQADGTWASKGEAYEQLVRLMKGLGVHGFRSVLWHQGESDANQQDPTRTLPGTLYREYLEQVIESSRRDIGWQAPWFVALASYHVPGDEGSPDIRAAQASLWDDEVALEGPDSDSLRGELRDSKGQGVHFSDHGLREHGKLWASKVGPWLANELKRE